MGWNNISIIKKNRIIENINDNSCFYFLHSFYIDCTNKDNIITQTHYVLDFPSVIVQDNIYGFQGHPEKSHGNGIKILKNFYNL